MIEPLRIQLVDEFSIEVEGRRVDRLRTRETEGLLAWLALHLGKPFTRAALIRRFWPDMEMSAGRSELDLALQSIRNEVGDALQTARDLVLLQYAWVDVLEDRAVSGELLPGFDFDWLALARAEFDQRIERNLQGRVKVALAMDDPHSAIDALYLLLERDPFNPVTYQRLYGLLIDLERHREARMVAGIAHVRVGSGCGLSASPMSPSLTFVGRSRLLAQLSEALLGDVAGIAVILAGAAGVGKTRIAEELVALARHEGIEALFVPLIGISTVDEVRAAVNDVLSPGLSPTLLVLDGCDGLSSQAGAWLSELRDHSSSLRLLLTTRSGIPSFSAARWPVAPLK